MEGAAGAGAPTVGWAAQMSPGDANLFQAAAAAAANGANFEGQVIALANAVGKVPGNSVVKMTLPGGYVVYGGRGLGIMNINGVTHVVSVIGDKVSVLGPLLP